MSVRPDNPRIPIRDIFQAEAFLDGRVNLEKIVAGRAGRMSLEPMHRLLAAVGHPEKSFRSILVGGTVGKGSTARFLASFLEGRGLRTGLYTSPHLERVSERIVVDGVEIAPEAFARAVEQLVPHSDASGASYFDLLTAAAFLHFCERGVAWAVVEVGLGGRVDSTNAMEPELCVITNVGSDHADVLGATISERAREKAGIVKLGVPLLTDAHDPRALAEIEKACAEKRAPLFRLPAATPNAPRHLPEFQQRNFALARLAFETLCQRQGWPPVADSESEKASRSLLPGRCERFEGDPLVILDGAHMPEAVEALLASLGDLSRPRALLFGAAADKDAAAMLKTLARWADRGFMCSANSPRSTAPADLLAFCVAAGMPAEACSSSRDGLLRARAFARGGTLLVTGSFYLAGEIRPMLRGGV